MQRATPIDRITRQPIQQHTVIGPYSTPPATISKMQSYATGNLQENLNGGIIIPTPILNHRLAEYAIDGLTFLKESGLVRLIDSRSEWQKKLLIEMGEKNKSGRLFRGKGDDILTDEKNNLLELATIRGLCATTLRVKLPLGYRRPDIIPSCPEVAEFLGYNSHSTIVYAYAKHHKDILEAIKKMGPERPPSETLS